MLLPRVTALAVIVLGVATAGRAHAQQFDIPAGAKAAIIDQTNAYRQAKDWRP